MMAKYGPLPEDWQEKWDPGTDRHFYWCSRLDKVSWLPPGHPSAKITEAASQVREMIQNQIHMEPDHVDDSDDSEEEDDEHAMELDSDMVIYLNILWHSKNTKSKTNADLF
jgi:polyglutamine-binding protein 1